MLGTFVVELAAISRRVADIKHLIKEETEAGGASLIHELETAECALIAMNEEVRRAFAEHHGLPITIAA